ncbi:MAG: NAD(P)-dependent oxidoreductase [Desulfurococcales archaeon]|nr:NAD(P)-dependent oxidoreductase [Desulfurococcales archaeon]
MPAKVAVFGTGLMGSAAAKRLKDKGFEVLLWDRTFEKAKKLASELGAKAFTSPAEAAGYAKYAIALVADDKALLRVAGTLGWSEGLIFINMSTVTPRAIDEIALYLKSVGACVVEAPLIGGPRVVEKGEAIALVGGPKECVDKGMEVVNAIASKVFKVGEEYGKAAALKLAFNNMLLAGLVSLVESLGIVEAYGIDRDLFKKVLESTFLSGVASRFFERVTADKVDTTFRAKLAAKDARYVSEAARGAGALPLLSDKVAEAYELMVYSGWGDEDYTSLLRFLRSLKRK